MGGSTTRPILSKLLKTAHKGLFCSLQANPAPAIVYRQRFSHLKSLAAVVVLSYFTASEKENLRTERKQNYVIKMEKKTLGLLLLERQKNDPSSLFSSSKLPALYSSEKVLSAQFCSLTCVSITVP